MINMRVKIVLWGKQTGTSRKAMNDAMFSALS